MALQLNLLHEEFAQQRQRQRDPLKLGMFLLSGLGVILVAFYMWKAYQTLDIKTRLGGVQRDWAKVEPEVTTAQKRATELSTTINTTKVLDTMIEGRFLWAPLLQKLSSSVAPNAQITSFEGSFAEDSKLVNLTIDGLAAGAEPRGAAEELRQLLTEQLGEGYSAVKVDFKALEDLETNVTLAGSVLPMAHYVLSVSFNPLSPEAAKAAQAPALHAPKK